MAPNGAAEAGFATGADRQAEEVRRRTQADSLQVPSSQSYRDGAEKSKEKVCLLHCFGFGACAAVVRGYI
jgi:hypothetical protein